MVRVYRPCVLLAITIHVILINITIMILVVRNILFIHIDLGLLLLWIVVVIRMCLIRCCIIIIRIGIDIATGRVGGGGVLSCKMVEFSCEEREINVGIGSENRSDLHVLR